MSNTFFLKERKIHEVEVKKYMLVEYNFTPMSIIQAQQAGATKFALASWGLGNLLLFTAH